MKVTYKWLEQYMDLSDVTPEELAEVMTRGGLEVEGYSKMASATKLVIGQVLECEPHPNSDHLHVCQVNTGNDVRQIVCGAPNVQKGQKVIVALPGCVLPGGEIKEGLVRGEQSNGMICALFELGVDKKQLTEAQLAGIEVLPEDAPIGKTAVLEYLGLDDTLYDVSLTSNRPDCLSMWSLAKEVGALLGKSVTLPDYSYNANEIEPELIIKSETSKCPYFEGKVVNNVTIKESPEWLKRALNAVGVKSINNVVDISNYVMLETGQPLHFYDLSKIPLREITVRDDIDETYTALDEQQYKINKGDIMITTGGQAIGIAGIMGGDDSKIEDSTTGIIIEAAAFNGVSIRNTSRRLGLDTDASVRFIKGVDPLGPHKAVERSVQLLIELADASGIEKTVFYGKDSFKERKIVASINDINHLLGTEFTGDEICSTFEKLSFEPEKLNKDRVEVTIPSYRTDITVWQDLAEEVIRLLGYDNIISTLPLMPTVQGGLSENGKLKRTVQSLLNGHGLSEIISYSLVSKTKIDEGILSCGQPVEIANPLSDERRYYRTSLLPSMLETISYNVARSNTEYGFFEMANVYNNENVEELHLSLALSETTTFSRWQNNVHHNDFFTMKGIVLSLLDKLGIDEKRIAFEKPADENEMLHVNKSADILIDRKLIGKLGVIHPACRNKYDIDECILAEINMSTIKELKKSKIRFTAIPRYPSVSFDLAMIVEDDVTAENITKVIRKAAGNLLKDVTVFDVYKGVGIPQGYKSVAVEVIYQSPEKTLSDSDISPVHSKVISSLQQQLKAQLRDS